ncbi:MAG: SDR family oxidoreductase [Candidatus Nealsonbacteria bacterium]
MLQKTDNQLKNKYVLVTGANKGTGFEIAKNFLLEGAIVGVHHYKDESGARKLFEYAKPGQCEIFEADFSKSKEVLSLWKEFISWSKGKIDVLVNNAAAIGQTNEDWDMVFQVNAKAPFLLSRLAFDAMSVQKQGRIINISSLSVKLGGSLDVLRYSASKAALEAITKSFAREGSRFNILVNAVRPGVTDSPIHKKLAQSDPSFKISAIPLNRFALPKEIADAVIFLAGSKSSFVTNTIIEVSGGQ